MEQTATQCFQSVCGKAKIYVDNTMPIGIFHDFLMEIKGAMVERMVVAHKDHEAQNAAAKAEDCESNNQENLPCAESCAPQGE